jgi:hypothetical protein
MSENKYVSYAGGCTSRCNCQTTCFAAVRAAVGADRAVCRRLQQRHANMPPEKTESCASSIPCTCNIADLQPYLAGSGALTCGDCSATPEGQSCFFFCPNSFDVLVGQSSIRCIKSSAFGGWAINTSSGAADTFPRCVPPVETCPPIVGTGGMNTYLGQTPLGASTCIGAQEDDVCYTSCWPNYYSPTGTYSSTCTNINGTLSWSNELYCECQSSCGQGIVCSTPNNVNLQTT